MLNLQTGIIKCTQMVKLQTYLYIKTVKEQQVSVCNELFSKIAENIVSLIGNTHPILIKLLKFDGKSIQHVQLFGKRYSLHYLKKLMKKLN